MEEEEISSGFIEEWEGKGIQYSHFQSSQSQSQSLNDLDPPNPSKQWSMVSIRDSDAGDGDSSVVFPPSNHEGLHISASTQNQQNHQSPPPWSPFDDPPFPPANSGRRRSGEVLRLMGFGFELFRLKTTRVIASLQSCAVTVSRGSFWSFRSAAGVALTAMILWLFCLRRRRNNHCRVRRESIDQLLLLIKEKDEKINQLLHQIAQMNQLLLVLQRVPLSKTS